MPDKCNLPPELLKLDQFIIWFEERKGDKLTKIPAAPWATGHWLAASATDPKNWTSFDNALEHAKKREGYGVGFAFKEGGGIVGIDLDKCINEYGVIDKPKSKLIEQANSYAEISPSGRGVHIFLKGELVGVIRSKEKGIEAYNRERYFTMTGKKWKDGPLVINENQELLGEIWEKYGEKNIKPVILDKSLERQDTIPITKVVPIQGLKRKGNQLQGPHPVHGSDTGMNFSINLEKNCWFCYRHMVGGGPLSWLAVQEGIIKCEEASRGALRGEKFKQVLKKTTELGLIPQEEKEEITDKFITDAIMGKHLFYCDITDINQVLYVFNGNHWSNGEAESVILNELSGIFEDEDQRRGMSLERTTNFIKGQAMNLKLKPKPPELISFKNGLLDITTGELNTHDKGYFYVNLIPHDYDPAAECPKWMKWLGEVIKLEDMEFLQEWVGYNFYASYPEPGFLVLIGSGQNGKTCFSSLFKKLIGEKNVTEISLADLTYNDFAPAQFEHKLANISDDIGSTTITNTGRLKKVSSGSGITVAKKFQQEHDITPYAKPTYSCNEPPEIKDSSEAIKLRLKVVEFPHIFVKNPKEGQKQARDRREIDKELEGEIPGIINWALEGLKRFINNNSTLTESKSTEETWEFYQRNSNPVVCFIEEGLEFTDDNQDVIFKEAMWKAFQAWSSEHKIKRKISRDKFFRAMKAQEVTPSRPREYEREQVYIGVKLVQTSKHTGVPQLPTEKIGESVKEDSKKKIKSGEREEKEKLGHLDITHQSSHKLLPCEFLLDSPAMPFPNPNNESKVLIFGPFARGQVCSIPSQLAHRLEQNGSVKIIAREGESG